MSSTWYGSQAGEIADEGSAAEAAFLEWLNEYTRHEAEPGRTSWDEMRAAFMAGRANLEAVKSLLGRELQSANAVIMRQMTEASGPVETLHRIADQDIGGNCPWLADELHELARAVEVDMSGPASPPPRRYSFTRDTLTDALTHLEVSVPVSGPDTGKINAESMADALIEALGGGTT